MQAESIVLILETCFAFSSEEQARAEAARAEAQRLEALRVQEEQRRVEQERRHQEQLRQIEIERANFRREQQRKQKQRVQVLVNHFLSDVTQLLISLPSVKVTVLRLTGRDRIT